MTGAAGAWLTDQLQRIDAAVELEIALPRTDGVLGRWTPVWVVRVGDAVFVRTWYRRETGWFARAVAVGRVRVRVPGVEADVTVVDLVDAAAGQRDPMEGPRELLDDVDAAYRTKYGAHGDATVGAMVSARARVTTLRLDRL